MRHTAGRQAYREVKGEKVQITRIAHIMGAGMDTQDKEIKGDETAGGGEQEHKSKEGQGKCRNVSVGKVKEAGSVELHRSRCRKINVPMFQGDNVELWGDV